MRLWQILYFFPLLLLFSCSTSQQEVNNIQKAVPPNDLYADVKVSSASFSGMSASGKIAVKGNEKMSIQLSALLGIKVMKGYFWEDSFKAAVYYNNTYVKEMDIYTKLKEKTDLDISRSTFLSLMKGSTPSNLTGIKEQETRKNGILYSRLLEKGVEYYLIDQQGRLIQYQQKTESNRTITILYSDFYTKDGLTLPLVVGLKVPELELDITLEYSNPKFQIPQEYEFEFEIPSGMERITLDEAK